MSMCFSFFHLPLEIRVIVYKELFGVSDPNRCFPPAPQLWADEYSDWDSGPYRQLLNENDTSIRRVDKGSASAVHFLQTCQQAHDEGTDVLYGSPVSYFDDIEGNLFQKIEVSENCSFCVRDKEIPRDYARRGCWESQSNGMQYENISVTSLMRMHTWLQAIGKKNRQKLRHIHLNFTHSRWTFFMSDITDAENTIFDGPYGGEYVKLALELPKNGRGLDTSRITFGLPKDAANSVTSKQAFLCIFASSYSDRAKRWREISGFKIL